MNVISNISEIGLFEAAIHRLITVRCTRGNRVFCVFWWSEMFLIVLEGIQYFSCYVRCLSEESYGFPGKILTDVWRFIISTAANEEELHGRIDSIAYLSLHDDGEKTRGGRSIFVRTSEGIISRCKGSFSNSIGNIGEVVRDESISTGIFEV